MSTLYCGGGGGFQKHVQMYILVEISWSKNILSWNSRLESFMLHLQILRTGTWTLCLTSKQACYKFVSKHSNKKYTGLQRNVLYNYWHTLYISRRWSQKLSSWKARLESFRLHMMGWSLWPISLFQGRAIQIRVITKLPNSEQSYKGKVKTHKYINRQNQSTTGKLWKP
jgi:hypothetical protein